MSSICRSAIHNGTIKDEEGGEFALTIVENPKTFYASNENGI
jgi:hypothetical protein